MQTTRSDLKSRGTFLNCSSGLVLPVISVCLLLIISVATAQESVLLLSPVGGPNVFKTKGCQQCHAIRGQGGTVAMDLGWHEYFGGVFDLATDLWNHSPIMREVMEQMKIERPAFTENEMAKLMAFLYYQRYLQKTGDVLRGKKLLSEKGCLRCHSVRGQGGTVARRLNDPSEYVSPLFMAQAMWNHGPEMHKKMSELNIGWPIFEDDEIVDLTNYIRILRKKSPKSDAYLRPGDPVSGKKLFESKQCMSCHAVDGIGGDIGPDFTHLELDKNVTELAGLMWNHGAEMIALMKTEGIEWPTFQGGEMGDLVSYLYSIDFIGKKGDSEHGQKLFKDKGCSSCHSKKDGEKTIGPDLSEMDALISAIGMAQIMWNHAPKMETMMKELELEWPEFNETEMGDLFAFLSKPSSVTGKQ
jgi:cytochrome c2